MVLLDKPLLTADRYTLCICPQPSLPTEVVICKNNDTKMTKISSPLIYLFRVLKAFSWYKWYLCSLFFLNLLKTSWILTKSIGHDVICSTQKKILISEGHYVRAEIVRFGIFCWNLKTKVGNWTTKHLFKQTRWSKGCYQVGRWFWTLRAGAQDNSGCSCYCERSGKRHDSTSPASPPSFWLLCASPSGASWPLQSCSVFRLRKFIWRGAKTCPQPN